MKKALIAICILLGIAIILAIVLPAKKHANAPVVTPQTNAPMTTMPTPAPTPATTQTSPASFSGKYENNVGQGRSSVFCSHNPPGFHDLFQKHVSRARWTALG